MYKYLFIASILCNVILGVLLFQYSGFGLDEEIHSPKSEYQEELITDEIYFIGNSIISPVDWAKMLGNEHVVNQAIAGITSTDAVMMSNELIPGKPKEVWIMLGINDIKSELPLELTIRNLSHFVFTIERISPKTRIRMLSVLPVHEAQNKYKITNDKVDQLNMLLRAFCTDLGFEFVDLYDVLLDESNNLAEAYTTDGLHLSDAGYVELGKAIKSRIRLD